MDLNTWHDDIIREDIENNDSVDRQEYIDAQIGLIKCLDGAKFVSDDVILRLKSDYDYEHDLKYANDINLKPKTEFKIDVVKSLYQQICFINERFDSAQIYYCILSDWQEELHNKDSVFYKFGMFNFAVYSSLVLACLLEICKIYDEDSSGGSIAKVMKQLSDNSAYTKICKESVLKFDKNRIGRYLSEYKDMTDILSKLNTQRDKILAHNDKNRQYVLDTCKMCVNDIDKLYRFVYKIIRFVRQHLSYDFKYDNILNTNDVENVKMCLEQGLMYGNSMSKSKE